VSAKVGTTALSANALSYKDGLYAATMKKSWKDTKAKRNYSKTLSFELDPDTGELQGTVEFFGSVFPSLGVGAWLVTYDLNVRKGGSDLDAEMLARAKAAGKCGMIVFKSPQRENGCDYDLSCPECVENPSAYKQTLFAKADANGKVTLTGTIAGKKVSGTAWLRRSELNDGEENVAYFFSAGFAIKIIYAFDVDGGYTNVYGEAWRQ